MLITGQYFRSQYFRITRFHLRIWISNVSLKIRKWIMSAYSHGNKESQVATAPFQRSRRSQEASQCPAVRKPKPALEQSQGEPPAPPAVTWGKKPSGNSKLSCQNTVSLQGPKGTSHPSPSTTKTMREKEKMVVWSLRFGGNMLCSNR